MEFKDRYTFNEEAHIHTLDGRPLTGTSSVMGIVGKPGLVWWASGEAVKTLGWTNPKFTQQEDRVKVAEISYEEIQGMGTEAYLRRLDTAYAAHSKSLNKAAKKGTDLHAELEKYVKLCIEKHDGKPLEVGGSEIQGFTKWAYENIEKYLWSEMHTYSEKLWLGGITDCGALMKDGRVAIIDFKSSKEAYPAQFWQIAGYGRQIEENGGFSREGEVLLPPTNIDLHIVIPFGAPEFTACIDQDTLANTTSFESALHLYRESQRLTKNSD